MLIGVLQKFNFIFKCFVYSVYFFRKERCKDYEYKYEKYFKLLIFFRKIIVMYYEININLNYNYLYWLE